MKREHRFFGENQTEQVAAFISSNQLWDTGYNVVYDNAALCFVVEWDDGVEELEWNN